MNNDSGFVRKIKRAHAKTGALGCVISASAFDGYYIVQTQYGRKRFRMKEHFDGRVTVYPCWSIAGDLQRKQATV